MTALIRRVNAAGGFATVLHKGDAERGAILVQTLENGAFQAFLERVESWSGTVQMVRCGPDHGSQTIELEQYISKRLMADRDLWVVELDIANAERFAVETITLG